MNLTWSSLKTHKSVILTWIYPSWKRTTVRNGLYLSFTLENAEICEMNRPTFSLKTHDRAKYNELDLNFTMENAEICEMNFTWTPPTLPELRPNLSPEILPLKTQIKWRLKSLLAYSWHCIWFYTVYWVLSPSSPCTLPFTLQFILINTSSKCLYVWVADALNGDRSAVIMKRLVTSKSPHERLLHFIVFLNRSHFYSDSRRPKFHVKLRQTCW